MERPLPLMEPWSIMIFPYRDTVFPFEILIYGYSIYAAVFTVYQYYMKPVNKYPWESMNMSNPKQTFAYVGI